MGVATSERLLDVAGMSVLVHTSDPDDRALLSRVLGERPGNIDAPGGTVKLVLGEHEPRVPVRTPDFAGPYGNHWIEDDTAQFRHHWGLSASIGHNSVVVGGPAKGYRRWVAVRNSMLFVLAHLYMQRGRYLLHSAALHLDATDDAAEATLLVLADSGRGKSTLTYAALRAGMAVMGDDMVVVTPSEAGIMAQGVPRVLTVPSDVLPGEADPTSVLPGDDRQRVELAEADLHPEPELITTVVLCDHDSGDGRLDRVIATDTVDHLAAAFVLSALADPMRKWFPTAMRLANGPSIALFHAADPDVRIERAVEMLYEATGRAQRSHPR